VNEAISIRPRELKVMIFKMAVLVSMALVLLAVLFSFITDSGQEIALPVLLISLSLVLVANGVLAVLKIIDWFENRAKHNG
jgi:hypothetical protein